MPRVFNQKIKILYLMRVFLERTDEEHPMSVKELIIYLNSLGISAERKTVYDDIETLRNFGMDILNRREQPAGFYGRFPEAVFTVGFSRLPKKEDTTWK